jgi:hypothetical protein
MGHSEFCSRWQKASPKPSFCQDTHNRMFPTIRNVPCIVRASPISVDLRNCGRCSIATVKGQGAQGSGRPQGSPLLYTERRERLGGGVGLGLRGRRHPLWSPFVLPSRGTRATTRVPTHPLTTPAPTGRSRFPSLFAKNLPLKASPCGCPLRGRIPSPL